MAQSLIGFPRSSWLQELTLRCAQPVRVFDLAVVPSDAANDETQSYLRRHHANPRIPTHTATNSNHSDAVCERANKYAIVLISRICCAFLTSHVTAPYGSHARVGTGRASKLSLAQSPPARCAAPRYRFTPSPC